MELPALAIVRCLESPKTLSELEKCASPPYRSVKELLLDLRLLKLLGIVREADSLWSLTEKGRIILRRVRRVGG